MNKFLSICLVLIITTPATCQSNIDEVIKSIAFETDTILSVFDWITDNIAYDVSIIDNPSLSKRSKQDKEDRIHNALKSKKGVCQHYSEILDSIVTRLGYESYVISGYTKNRQGKINGDIGHAWNAIKVNGSWQLYDATWAAGHIKDERKFVKQYNSKWYNISPSEMLETHMPYDPIWQLKDPVVTYRSFENGSLEPSISLGNLDSIIGSHLVKIDRMQTKDALERSNALGPCHSIVRTWKDRMNQRISGYVSQDQAGDFNSANIELRSIGDSFRSYINAKNSRFKSKKWTKSYCIELLTNLQERTSYQLEVLKSIKPKEKDRQKTLKMTISKTTELVDRLESELTFNNTKR